jgi:hypothetical protein
MNDFSRRIAALSPAQLQLLKLRLKKEGIDPDTNTDTDADISKGAKNLYPPLQPLEKKEYYPLSSAQKRLFTINRMEGIGITYVISFQRILRESLEEKRVEQVFKTLIHRHESLRASFTFIGGDPVQRIHPEVDFAVRYDDTSGQPPIHPFDLSQPPLFRVILIRLAEKKYHFIMNLHHIISDAISNRLIWTEFNRLYNRQPVDPLKIQYRDFSQWQNSEAVKSARQHQENYWLNVFRGELPVIHLPTAWPRPAIKRYEGGYRFFKIDHKGTSSLNALALKENTTLFIILLSIYNLFLAKISRQKDIIVGIPIAGRRHRGLDNIIGMFVNTLALRNYPGDEATFAAFLKEVRQRALEAFENQDYPFDDLVNKVFKQRDPSRNPLFDVFFSFRAPGVSQEMPEIPGEENASRHGSLLSMFDLYLMGTEVKEELILVLIYSAALFELETISRFVGYIKEIIAAVTENNHIKLKDINIAHDLGFARPTISPAEESDFGF